MEDDLNFTKMEHHPNFFSPNGRRHHGKPPQFLKNEKRPNFFKNERQPQYLQNGRQPGLF
jgi:hypothetical protein